MSDTILSALDRALADTPPPPATIDDSLARGVRPATLAAVVKAAGGLKLLLDVRARVGAIIGKIEEATRDCSRFSPLPANVGRCYKEQRTALEGAFRAGKRGASAASKDEIRSDFKVRRQAAKAVIRAYERDLADAMRDALTDLSRRIDAHALEVEKRERALASELHVSVPPSVSLVVRKVSDDFRSLSEAKSISPSTLKPFLP